MLITIAFIQWGILLWKGGRRHAGHLGDDAPLLQIPSQSRQSLQLQVPAEDQTHLFGLGFVRDELLVLHHITKRHRPAHAHGFLLARCNLAKSARERVSRSTL